MTAGTGIPPVGGSRRSGERAVRITTSADRCDAYVEIRLVRVFLDEYTREEAVDQLLNGIQQAALFLDNDRTKMHLHHIIYNQQSLHKRNLVTSDYYIGRDPSYEEVIEAVYQLTVRMDSLMLRPENRYIRTYQLFVHLSC